VIANKNSYGAGRFGPGTRAQAKKDYKNYLANGSSSNTSNEVVIITEKPKVEKIDKKSLLTREEIESREVEEFLKDFNVSLQFQEVG
jgi:hypothetical protein